MKVIFPLATLAVAVLIAGFLWSTKPRLDRNVPEERTWVVSGEMISFGDERPLFNVFGEVVAGRQVDLRTLVAGSVVRTGMNFVEGGMVRKGDELIVIDSFDYKATLDERLAQLEEGKARLAEIQARLDSEQKSVARDREQFELIKRDAERKSELFMRGNVSQKIVDDAELAVSRQLQQVTGRETSIRIEQARRAQQVAAGERLGVGVRRARRDLERTRLVAPFDGFLSKIASAVGKRLSANDVVATLIAADRFEVRLHLSDDQYGRILGTKGGLEGRTASVFWSVGGHEMKFPAVIDRISPLIDTTSGGVDLYALVEGVGNDSPLRPGAFVKIELADRTYKRVARIPSSSLHGGEMVYVVIGGRLESRLVRVVARYGAEILVRGNLEDGEWVVSSRFAEISPGLKVEMR